MYAQLYVAAAEAAGEAEIFQLELGENETLQTITRIIAVGIIFIFLAYAAFQYAVPSRRAGASLRSTMSVGKLLGLVFLLIFLIDLNSIDLFIKIAYKTVVGVWGFFSDNLEELIE